MELIIEDESFSTVYQANKNGALAYIIPKQMAEALQITKGTKLRTIQTNNSLVITKI